MSPKFGKEYLRAWRRAHPDNVKKHVATQNEKRKDEPPEKLGEWQKTSKRNEKRKIRKSRRDADMNRSEYTPGEDAAILSDLPARKLAWMTGRTIDAIYSRRAELRRREPEDHR